MRGLPLTCGETPWSPDGTSHSTRQHSTQQQAQFAALHSLHSPAVSHARASLCLLSSNFLTPERIFFSSPATSWRQSESSSLLQRFPTPERFFFSSPAISYARAILLLFSFHTSEISFVFTVLGGLDDAFTLLPLFFYATISWLFWDFSSGCLPFSFLWQPFLPRCHLKDFLSDIFSPSSFPAGTQAVVTSPSGRNHHSWAKRYLEGVDNFGFGTLLGVLLSLQNDSSSSQTNILQSSRCISFWVDVSMIQGCRSYPCCWLVLPFPLLPAGTAYTCVFRSSNFSVLSFSILHTSIRSLSALDHLVSFTLYSHP